MGKKMVTKAKTMTKSSSRRRRYQKREKKVPSKSYKRKYKRKPRRYRQESTIKFDKLATMDNMILLKENTILSRQNRRLRICVTATLLMLFLLVWILTFMFI